MYPSKLTAVSGRVTKKTVLKAKQNKNKEIVG